VWQCVVGSGSYGRYKGGSREGRSIKLHQAAPSRGRVGGCGPGPSCAPCSLPKTLYSGATMHPPLLHRPRARACPVASWMPSCWWRRMRLWAACRRRPCPSRPRPPWRTCLPTASSEHHTGALRSCIQSRSPPTPATRPWQGEGPAWPSAAPAQSIHTFQSRPALQQPRCRGAARLELRVEPRSRGRCPGGEAPLVCPPLHPPWLAVGCVPTLLGHALVAAGHGGWR